MKGRGLGLFQGFGVELEYMIVARETLEVAPLTDRLLQDAAGHQANELERGALRWSNELVMHVVELKTNGPAAKLDGLAAEFSRQVNQINALLEPSGAMLMPGAMHPWMAPDRHARLWPYGNREIYSAYDRIFGCRGHGWSNLQSAHLNLPFADDAEFGRLHAAVRLVLPLLSALAAASPVLDGAPTGLLDNRLEVYRHNQSRVPEIAGQVIPEQAYSAAAYQRLILEPMYRAIAPLDPGSILQEEWLNSRGAIARFERNTIEIRLLDVQECPAADLAIAQLVVAVLKDLVRENTASLVVQQSWSTQALADLFLSILHEGPDKPIADPAYLRLWGVNAPSAAPLEIWHRLADRLLSVNDPAWPALGHIFSKGPLARRLLRALGPQPGHEQQFMVYRELCACLHRGELFDG